MRELTSMSNNIFTTKLLDVIIPSSPERNGCLFIVMEYVDFDLKRVLNKTENMEFSEEHVVTIMYNSLCALNFLHSLNIMHRDIKPANMLIDDQCVVKICDFGLSRTVPSNNQINLEIRNASFGRDALFSPKTSISKTLNIFLSPR